jgi:hypothetical protein
MVASSCVTKNTVFRILTTCSSEIILLFGGIYCLYLQGRRVSQPENQKKQGKLSLILKVEFIRSFETSVCLRTTRYYKSEDDRYYSLSSTMLESQITPVYVKKKGKDIPVPGRGGP